MKTEEVVNQTKVLMQTKEDTEKIVADKKSELQELLAKDSLNSSRQTREKIANLREEINGHEAHLQEINSTLAGLADLKDTAKLEDSQIAGLTSRLLKIDSDILEKLKAKFSLFRQNIMLEYKIKGLFDEENIIKAKLSSLNAKIPVGSASLSFNIMQMNLTAQFLGFADQASNEKMLEDIIVMINKAVVENG